MADNILHTNEHVLLTFKGLICIQYLDGEIVSGEFVAQDAYNVFLNVNGESLMIPRQQIRMIKGLQGQRIEADNALSAKSDALQLQLNTNVGLTIEKPQDIPSSQPLNSQPNASPEDISEAETFVVTHSSRIGASMTKQGDLTIPLDDSERNEKKVSTGLRKESTATFTCISGPYCSEIFMLKKDITTIGRCKDNDIVLCDDKEVSCHHAIVANESGKYVVHDQNSLNGTFVNNVQTAGACQLESGDEISLGVSILKYEWIRRGRDAATTKALKSFG